ncbi:ketopantoate hydroxymethyltransferase [Cytobacillus sp.]|uniref:ketopantoate hydroxymethyltransferase n=1 Tax=Cytobacillus sp. TaxID=2675269 RepID=UPI0028BD27E3|nr:ketopantoate hydroxymethyltransferase [Cytobacillus sp.]
MISEEFLSEVAIFTDKKINKVVLNGTYQVPNFDLKKVAANELSMRYTVPFGSVETIQQIELKDEWDNVITSNHVYVPISSDTILSQTIFVKEA